MNTIIINLPHTADFRLPPCPGYHPETMRVCDPAAVACHDEFCPPDKDGAANPVLLFAPLLQGATLLDSVDLADVHDEYEPGERTLQLHSNSEIFTGQAGEPVTLFTVTHLWLRADEAYVSAFTNLDAARAYFNEAATP
jgi:hypothetical protein